MKLPKNCQSSIASAQYKGQKLVPDPGSIVQSGPTCAFCAIVACAIIQHRLTMFRMGTISMVFFDTLSFILEYKWIYGPLELDNGPRVKRALTMFKDQGIMTYNLSGSPPYYPRPMKIKEFTSYPPLPDPSRLSGTLVLSFEFVASIIQQGRPVLGSFPIRTDEDSEGFTDFDKLGDKICKALEFRK